MGVQRSLASRAAARLDSISAELLAESRNPALAELIVERAVDALNGYAGLLCTLDDATSTLRVRATYGYPEAFVDQYRVMDVAAPFPACVATRSARPLIVPNTEAYARAFPGFRASTSRFLRTRAFVYVPVMYERRLTGVLGVSFDHERAPDVEDLAVLDALARFAGCSVAR